VTLADLVAVWLARWWRITGAMTAISRVGGEARKETTRRVGFSPATLPLVAGVDGGVPRRPWDLRQRQGLLESWWLEANGERVSRATEKKEKREMRGHRHRHRRRRRRPWCGEAEVEVACWWSVDKGRTSLFDFKKEEERGVSTVAGWRGEAGGGDR